MKKYSGIIISIIIPGAVCFLITLGLRGGTTAPVFSEKVRKMGYEDVSQTPCEIVEFIIPEEFSRVYDRYNELLKKGGYDLTEYKGKRCKRYTYLIPSENARANIIVHNGEIIGGDISGITIDGIMLPLLKDETKNNQ